MRLLFKETSREQLDEHKEKVTQICVIEKPNTPTENVFSIVDRTIEITKAHTITTTDDDGKETTYDVEYNKQVTDESVLDLILPSCSKSEYVWETCKAAYDEYKAQARQLSDDVDEIEF